MRKTSRGRSRKEGLMGKTSRGRSHEKGLTRKVSQGRSPEEGLTRKVSRGRSQEEGHDAEGMKDARVEVVSGRIRASRIENSVAMSEGNRQIA